MKGKEGNRLGLWRKGNSTCKGPEMKAGESESEGTRLFEEAWMLLTAGALSKRWEMELERWAGVNHIKKIRLYPRWHRERHWRRMTLSSPLIWLFLEGYWAAVWRKGWRKQNWVGNRYFRTFMSSAPVQKLLRNAKGCVLFFFLWSLALIAQQRPGHRAVAQGRVLTQTLGRSNDRNVSVQWSPGFKQRGCFGFSYKYDLLSSTLWEG